MSFELKNIGATYQRVMVSLFHDMMHKEIEVYVDDMTSKPRPRLLWAWFGHMHNGITISVHSVYPAGGYICISSRRLSPTLYLGFYSAKTNLGVP
ncbi:hypothetical protein CR513_44671, partial [Mucuna pruriens]